MKVIDFLKWITNVSFPIPVEVTCNAISRQLICRQDQCEIVIAFMQRVRQLVFSENNPCSFSMTTGNFRP